MQIQVEGNNAQVVMAAQQADTRQALEQALPSLASALQEAGLTLTGGGVFEQRQGGERDAGGEPGSRGPTGVVGTR
ncbi:flagellar hook-length control protein FliK, partial [Rubrivivax gelatinosus]|uniref:flagellar hook-length control protein FliK n=1 Tax=Rubrivivax gelatinosus TaxID=28068 RepID=UPI0005C227E8